MGCLMIFLWPFRFVLQDGLELLVVEFNLVHDDQYTGHCVFIYLETQKCRNFAIRFFPIRVFPTVYDAYMER